MKTFEDEAFDELAKKQGAWGGGYQAKRAAAADKLHWSDCAVHNAPAYPAGECDCGVEQKPANYLHAVLSAFGPDEGISLDQKAWSKLHTDIKAGLAQPAQKITYPVTGWKVEVRGSNQRLFITGVYGDTIFVDLPEAQPAQEPPKYAIKAYWEDDGRIGVVATVERPDGGYHLLGAIIDPPPAKEKNT